METFATKELVASPYVSTHLEIERVENRHNVTNVGKTGSYVSYYIDASVTRLDQMTGFKI